MLKGLDGKRVLITGAAGNIGLETVDRLVAEGAMVVASDINAEALADIAAKHGDRVATVAGDIGTSAGAAAAVAAGAAFGGLDMAFVNAGVECISAPISEFDPAEFDRVFHVNVRGAFLTAQAMVRHLTGEGRPGAVLFTASIAGLQGSPMTSIYNASKSAVIGIARSLALEVGALGIRVNTLCPGPVASRMMTSLEDSIAAITGMAGADIRAHLQATAATGRYATPTEVASMAAWILSDEVPYCHGEVFTVTGGMLR